jgi:hypothetical protein
LERVAVPSSANLDSLRYARNLAVRVFVSYAHEDRDPAERIALALRESDNQVFFDRDALPEGDGFHRRIRKELQASDCMVFLLSPDSVDPGSYCLSELKLARQRWPHPGSSVLPVLVRDMEFDAIPNYLRAVTVLMPEGDVAAEVEACIARWTAIRNREPWKLEHISGGSRASPSPLDLQGVGAAFMTLLSDSVRSQIPTATPQGKARELSYGLYECLQEVRRHSRRFVNALETVASRTRADSPHLEDLRAASSAVMHGLSGLQRALQRVNPQLKIHDPQLVDGILMYREMRALTLSDLEEGAGAATTLAPNELASTLDRARANQAILERAIDEMEQFLRREFSFADSF